MSWGNGQPLEGCSWSPSAIAGVSMALVIGLGAAGMALAVWLG